MTMMTARNADILTKITSFRVVVEAERQDGVGLTTVHCIDGFTVCTGGHPHYQSLRGHGSAIGVLVKFNSFCAILV